MTRDDGQSAEALMQVGFARHGRAAPAFASAESRNCERLRYIKTIHTFARFHGMYEVYTLLTL